MTRITACLFSLKVRLVKKTKCLDCLLKYVRRRGSQLRLFCKTESLDLWYSSRSTSTVKYNTHVMLWMAKRTLLPPLYMWIKTIDTYISLFTIHQLVPSPERAMSASYDEMCECPGLSVSCTVSVCGGGRLAQWGSYARRGEECHAQLSSSHWTLSSTFLTFFKTVTRVVFDYSFTLVCTGIGPLTCSSD